MMKDRSARVGRDAAEERRIGRVILRTEQQWGKRTGHGQRYP